jgi:hypothetical protein
MRLDRARHSILFRSKPRQLKEGRVSRILLTDPQQTTGKALI